MIMQLYRVYKISKGFAYIMADTNTHWLYCFSKTKEFIFTDRSRKCIKNNDIKLKNWKLIR